MSNSAAHSSRTSWEVSTQMDIELRESALDHSRGRNEALGPGTANGFHWFVNEAAVGSVLSAIELEDTKPAHVRVALINKTFFIDKTENPWYAVQYNNECVAFVAASRPWGAEIDQFSIERNLYNALGTIVAMRTPSIQDAQLEFISSEAKPLKRIRNMAQKVVGSQVLPAVLSPYQEFASDVDAAWLEANTGPGYPDAPTLIGWRDQGLLDNLAMIQEQTPDYPWELRNGLDKIGL